MEVGLIKRIDIDTEMQQSYLDYAMSVIIARALPDARDGLKPVHRRILYAMHAMGMRADAPYRKSARIVGEVLGKYHPHGDMAVYDAMVRMAQPFAMRYPIIEGQGNFGSIDGDPPAAMRYTEARLSPLSLEIMNDLDKQTVPFVDNFDGSLREPGVLPAAIPNMLVNGATGIAVGMSTSIPPHNMTEVCDALIHMLDNWTRLDEITIDDLMNYVQGPDFPTGGIILRKSGDGDNLASAYGTGRGKLTLQARAHIEEMGRGRSRIIVTELPYQTNKASLIERIADLARGGKFEGLSDLRDESDRDGMRIVLELSKAADPEKILAELYRRTPMQNTFSVIMLALVDGEPRMLSLKQALRVFLEHRVEVVRRRSEFALTRARQREHILIGLRTALDNLDDVISLIRKARDADQAHQRLMKRYELSELQAQAILDMPLRRLASLERKKIDTEFKELQARIKELESLLRSGKKLRGLISAELAEIKDRYGDRRRTLIAATSGSKKQTVLTASDLAPDKETWVVVSAEGMVFRTPTARLPAMSGRSAPRLIVGANTRDLLYLFEKDGSAAVVPVHTVPESDDARGGKQFTGLTPLRAEEELAAGIAIPPSLIGGEEGLGTLFFTTASGMVKKTDLSALPGPSARPFEAIKVGDGDELGWVELTHGKDDVILLSRAGMAIRFSESDVRPMGLSASGVMGIRLEENEDRVVGMGVVTAKQELLIVTEDGQAKRSPLKDFPSQGRYGKGVIAWKSGQGVNLAGGAVGETKDRAVIRFARSAPRSLRFGDAPRRVRASAGKSLFELGQGNRVTNVEPAQPRPMLDDAADGAGADSGGEAKKKSTPSPKKSASKGKGTRTAAKKSSGSRAKQGGSKKSSGSAKKSARKGKRTRAASKKPSSSRAKRGSSKKSSGSAKQTAGKKKSQASKRTKKKKS
jgi:DNA gyrase subunit A